MQRENKINNKYQTFILLSFYFIIVASLTLSFFPWSCNNDNKAEIIFP